MAWLARLRRYLRDAWHGPRSGTRSTRNCTSTSKRWWRSWSRAAATRTRHAQRLRAASGASSWSRRRTIRPRDRGWPTRCGRTSATGFACSSGSRGSRRPRAHLRAGDRRQYGSLHHRGRSPAQAAAVPRLRPGRVIFLRSSSLDIDWSSYGVADFQALAGRQHRFQHVAAFTSGGGFTLLGADGPTQVPGSRVTAGFFAVLGVSPMLGRTFQRDDDLAAGPRRWSSAVASGRNASTGIQPRSAAASRSTNGATSSWRHAAGLPLRAQRRGPSVADPAVGDPREPSTVLPERSWTPGDRVSMEAATTDVSRHRQGGRSQYPRSDYHNGGVVPFKETLVGGSRLALLLLLGPWASSWPLPSQRRQPAARPFGRPSTRDRHSFRPWRRPAAPRPAIADREPAARWAGRRSPPRAGIGTVRMTVRLAPNVVPRSVRARWTCGRLHSPRPRSCCPRRCSAWLRCCASGQ